jgi:S-DNA-T family DNA segregation ATPase FtsK/SpoIIIE
MRVQGAFVSEGEVENIVTFIRDNNKAGKFNAEFIKMIDEKAAQCGVKKGAQGGGGFDSDSSDGEEGGDSKFHDAVKLAIEEGKVATSLLQRRLGVGYGRAAKIIDAMEERGYVSKPDGNKPRRVLITMEEYMRRKMNNELDDISDDDL